MTDDQRPDPDQLLNRIREEEARPARQAEDLFWCFGGRRQNLRHAAGRPPVVRAGDGYRRWVGRNPWPPGNRRVARWPRSVTPQGDSLSGSGTAGVRSRRRSGAAAGADPGRRTGAQQRSRTKGCRIPSTGETPAPRRPGPHDRPNPRPAQAEGRSPGAAGRSDTDQFARDGDGHGGRVDIPGRIPSRCWPPPAPRSCCISSPGCGRCTVWPCCCPCWRWRPRRGSSPRPGPAGRCWRPPCSICRWPERCAIPGRCTSGCWP